MTTVAAPLPGVARPLPTTGRRRLRVFLRNPFAVAGAVFIVILLCMALVPGFFAPYDPNAQSLTEKFLPPGGDHLLGTDALGRDQLSRLIYGSRASMLAGVEAVGIALLVGVPLGMLAAYFTGWFGAVMDRVNDALMSVPGLLPASTGSPGRPRPTSAVRRSSRHRARSGVRATGSCGTTCSRTSSLRSSCRPPWPSAPWCSPRPA